MATLYLYQGSIKKQSFESRSITQMTKSAKIRIICGALSLYLSYLHFSDDNVKFAITYMEEKWSLMELTLINLVIQGIICNLFLRNIFHNS